jgi:D-mannonate dehydratase
LIKRHTVSVLKKHDVRLAFSHLRAIDRFAHRDGDLSAAAKVTNENMRAIAKAVSGRRGMLLICGDHEAHLKGRKASHRKATVPLIVECP